ncbi:hypothetical protein L9F63_001885 [Diploptera punctata]|uniref:RRM domain-containing protein n=1 Tax=Diploptera punctata TaxID=6984 RepID=A0AAD8A343_DIPPU|nr:hypothetical protein L9F63_001885 [Diploptera punctata]
MSTLLGGQKNQKNVPETKKPKKKNPKFLGRGVVYLRHIPKGFHEEEMSKYFRQFGHVTRLNLVRSKCTGRPKGYAFIEFLYSEVAQVVAETMNNYLMFGKVLKAEYIPSEKIRRAGSAIIVRWKEISENGRQAELLGSNPRSKGFCLFGDFN